jgi:hypothetical protein
LLFAGVVVSMHIAYFIWLTVCIGLGNGFEIDRAPSAFEQMAQAAALPAGILVAAIGIGLSIWWFLKQGRE